MDPVDESSDPIILEDALHHVVYEEEVMGESEESDTSSTADSSSSSSSSSDESENNNTQEDISNVAMDQPDTSSTIAMEEKEVVHEETDRTVSQDQFQIICTVETDEILLVDEAREAATTTVPPIVRDVQTVSSTTSPSTVVPKTTSSPLIAVAPSRTSAPVKNNPILLVKYVPPNVQKSPVVNATTVPKSIAAEIVADFNGPSEDADETEASLKRENESPLRSTGATLMECPDTSVDNLELLSGVATNAPAVTVAAAHTKPTVSQTIERTVNLLNNNKILIKSVKCTKNVPPAAIKSESNDSNDVKPIEVGDATTSQSVEHVKQHSGQLTLDAAPASTHTDTAIETKQEHIEGGVGSSDTDVIEIAHKAAPKIKREFEQLQKTVNESKVLMEYVIDRKARGRRAKKSVRTNQSMIDLDDTESMASSYQGMNSSRSPSRNESPIMGARSASKESDRSATSIGNRSMRSLNAEFTAKQQKFLRNLQKNNESGDESDDSVKDDDESMEFFDDSADIQLNTTENKSMGISPKDGCDKFCWRCHQAESLVSCSNCIRSYHASCVKLKQSQKIEIWVCPECVGLQTADECQKTKKYDMSQLKVMLIFAYNRIILVNGSKHFRSKIDAHTDYNKYVINAVYLDDIPGRVNAGKYTSTEAFVNEFKWILHNTSIYFAQNAKIMGAAKNLLKICKQEIYEIDTCHECYLNANTEKENWFVEVCSRPHLILWAKLKGFPYWPAKAMAYSSEKGVDVRFFGDHDRAFVPVKDCFIYSRSDPNPTTNKQKRNTIADCVKEVDVYIERLIEKFGTFNYAEVRTPYNPLLEDQHLAAMIPKSKDSFARRKTNNAANKSELTLKIVKSADNNLSVVNLTPLSNEDISMANANGKKDEPVPINRRKSKATPKSANKAHDTEEARERAKSYQVLRRASMLAERDHPKKVSAVILKRKSVHVNNLRIGPNAADDTDESPPKKGKVVQDSTPEKRSQKTPNESLINGNNETDNRSDQDWAVPTAMKGTRSSSRRPKSIYIEKPAVEAMDTNEGVTSSKIDERRNAVDNGRIKRSERLMSRSQKDRDTPAIDAAKGQSAQSAQSPQLQQAHSSGSERLPTTSFLRPFIEVKQEEPDDFEMQLPPQTSTSKSSSKRSTISDIIDVDAIKQEIMSDSEDQTLDLTNCELSADRGESSISRTINRLMSSLNSTPYGADNHSSITLSRITSKTSQGRSINMAINQSAIEPRARKTFPNGLIVSNGSNKPPDKMVYIPKENAADLSLSNCSILSDALRGINANASICASTQTTSNTPKPSTSTSTPNPEPQPPVAPSEPQTSTAQPEPMRCETPSTTTTQSINEMLSASVSDNLAAAVGDVIARAPPQLQRKPTGAMRSDGDVQFALEKGSVSRVLIDNSHKMADFFRTVIEDTLQDMTKQGNLEARVKMLELELENLKTTHTKQITEMTENNEKLLNELKKNMENERLRAINEVRKQCEAERMRAVQAAKRKHWCTNCEKEAELHCCYETWYCDYPCQNLHWNVHEPHCLRITESFIPTAVSIATTTPSIKKLSVANNAKQQPLGMAYASVQQQPSPTQKILNQGVYRSAQILQQQPQPTSSPLQSLHPPQQIHQTNQTTTQRKPAQRKTAAQMIVVPPRNMSNTPLVATQQSLLSRPNNKNSPKNQPSFVHQVLPISTANATTSLSQQCYAINVPQRLSVPILSNVSVSPVVSNKATLHFSNPTPGYMSKNEPATLVISSAPRAGPKRIGHN